MPILMRSPKSACHLMVACILFVVSGCSDSSSKLKVAPETPPVLIIGIDGLEWNLLLPLIHEGEAPNIEALMERGSFGLYETLNPTLSPIIWTTIATGKPPQEHGIHGFARKVRDGGEESLKLFESTDRRTKAFWNILTEYGKRVAVVGWWMTYPAEPVNGVMVAQTNTIDQIDVEAARNVWKGALLKGIPGQVFPLERQNEFIDDLEAIDRDLPFLLRDIFGTFPHPLVELDRRLWDNCQWAFRADATYARIAKKLLAESPSYDVLSVYFGGPDVVSHRFWRYMEPDKFVHTPTPEQVENFSRIIRNYYIYMDQVIGELVSLAGDHTRIIVMSDHGFHEENTHAHFDPNSPPKNINSGHHMDAPPGVFIAAGPDIPANKSDTPMRELRRSQLPTPAHVTDFTPTLLAMLGIPVGEDMHGKVRDHLISDDLLGRCPVSSVATHDTENWRDDLDVLAQARDESERQQQLKALGYIE